MTDQSDSTTVRITHAERIRWQRDATAVLAKLLELAAKQGLPAIGWSVQHAGARLVGECRALPYEQRRAEFAAWREALGEPDSDREGTTTSGSVRLAAVWERGGSAGKGLRPLLSDRDGYQRATVVLSADILPDLDDEDEAEADRAVRPSEGMRQLQDYLEQADGPEPEAGQ